MVLLMTPPAASSAQQSKFETHVVPQLDILYRTARSLTRSSADAEDLGVLAAESDVVYMTPQKPHQLSLFTEIPELDVPKYDALYVTRPQTERYADEGEGGVGSYMRLGQETMAAESLRDRAVVDS